MSDMPQVKPRDMHALLSGLVTAHAAVRDDIANAAEERAKYYADKDKELNAQARLEGKTTT
jgi:hypothetical protein